MEKKSIYIVVAIVLMVLAAVVFMSLRVGKAGSDYIGGLTGTKAAVESARQPNPDHVDSAIRGAEAIRGMAQSRKNDFDEVTRQR